MSGSLWFLAQNLLSASQAAKRQKFNPRPLGSVMPGSVTEQVLDCLKEHAPRFLTRAQIVGLTQAPPKSVDWALHVLKRNGAISERCSNDPRSSRYLTYTWRQT